MKVNPLTQAMQFLGVVRETKDGHGRNPQREKKEEEKKKREEEVSFEEITEAVEQFQTDAQTQPHGLSASLAGSGFGLRVILKDGTGAVIRQMTGEEFVRLRQESTQLSRPRGKILDQKL